MIKTLRQRAVLAVLKHGSIASQEDLQRHLRRRDSQWVKRHSRETFAI